MIILDLSLFFYALPRELMLVIGDSAFLISLEIISSILTLGMK